MKDYPDNVPWSAVLTAFAQLAAVIALMAVVYLMTRITPAREAELKAQGAAEADRKAAAAGGWSAWIAREINADPRRVGYVAGYPPAKQPEGAARRGASRPGETEVR